MQSWECMVGKTLKKQLVLILKVLKMLLRSGVTPEVLYQNIKNEL